MRGGSLREGSLGSGSANADVILVKGPEGALSMEFGELRDGAARAFLRFSPRNLKLSRDSARKLSEELLKTGYQRVLVQDSRKRLLERSLRPMGWRVERAIEPALNRKCSLVTTYDIPLDEDLTDSDGVKPDISNTSHMLGISVDLDGRKGWVFYTDEVDTARVVSEGERKQGMIVAKNTEDIDEIVECLVRFLAHSRKSWVVFSMSMGRFVRQLNPITMMRMTLDAPKGYDHMGVPLSRANRKAAIGLFSEYYDESTLQSMLRLRRFRVEGNYSIYLIDGGFTITKLEGDTGLIYDIYVTPSKQGQGLGAELMRCALTSLSGKVSSVYLHTSYPRAKKLYEKFGFKAVYSQLGIRLDEVALSPPSVR